MNIKIAIRFLTLSFALFLLAACAAPQKNASPTTAPTLTAAPPTSTPEPAPTLPPTVQPSPTPIPALADVVGLVCQGQASPGSAGFNSAPGAIHKVAIVDELGKPHEWNQFLPVSMQAKSVPELEAVLCLGEQTPGEPVQDGCGSYQDSQGMTIPLGLAPYQRSVRLVDANSAQIIDERQATGELAACPQSIDTSNPKLINSTLLGEDVNFEDVFAAMLPAIVPQSAPHLVTTLETGAAALALSPDGSLLASADFSNTNVTLWDVQKAARLFTLPGHAGQVGALSFSPDGGTLASSADSGEIILWDTRSGNQLHTLAGHLGTPQVVFSPDGSLLFSTGVNTGPFLWDVKSGAVLQDFSQFVPNASVATFSSDGKRLATGGWDPTLLVWDIADGQPLQKFKAPEEQLDSLALNLDGTLLAAQRGDTVTVYDVQTGEEKATLMPESSLDGIFWMGFSQDGQRLALLALGEGYQFDEWDSTSGNLVRGQAQEAPYTWTNVPVIYQPDQNWLISYDYDRQTLLVLDLVQHLQLARLKYENKDIQYPVASGDGKHLAVGPNTGELVVWDLSWLSK